MDMTNDRKAAMASLWKKFGFKVNSLSERIKLQKTIYLLANLGYKDLKPYLKTYSMYIYGPYSSKVAKDAFELSQENFSSEKLSEEQENILKCFIDIKSMLPDKNDAPEYMGLELLANITFFANMDKTSTPESLFETLKKKKIYFDDKEYFGKALDILRKNNLIHL